MTNPREDTVLFHRRATKSRAGWIIDEVYRSLQQKGYDPVSQMVGYLLSGDPTYITSYRDARNLIRGLDRDEILEELIKGYLNAQS